MGHANGAITARIYAYALAKGDSAAVATLAGAFGLRKKVTFDKVHSRQASCRAGREEQGTAQCKYIKKRDAPWLSTSIKNANIEHQ